MIKGKLHKENERRGKMEIVIQLEEVDVKGDKEYIGIRKLMTE